MNRVMNQRALWGHCSVLQVSAWPLTPPQHAVSCHMMLSEDVSQVAEGPSWCSEPRPWPGHSTGAGPSQGRLVFLSVSDRGDNDVSVSGPQKTGDNGQWSYTRTGRRPSEEMKEQHWVIELSTKKRISVGNQWFSAAVVLSTNTRSSGRSEDSCRHKGCWKRETCTLKVGLQHMWDSLQISHCHQHRHAPDQRRTLPPLFAPV